MSAALVNSQLVRLLPAGNLKKKCSICSVLFASMALKRLYGQWSIKYAVVVVVVDDVDDDNDDGHNDNCDAGDVKMTITSDKDNEGIIVSRY